MKNNKDNLPTLEEIDNTLKDYYLHITNVLFDVEDYIDVFEIYKKKYPNYNNEQILTRLENIQITIKDIFEFLEETKIDLQKMLTYIKNIKNE